MGLCRGSAIPTQLEKSLGHTNHLDERVRAPAEPFAIDASLVICIASSPNSRLQAAVFLNAILLILNVERMRFDTDFHRSWSRQ